MAAASPSVFLLMVNGQVESAQVSSHLLLPFLSLGSLLCS